MRAFDATGTAAGVSVRLGGVAHDLFVQDVAAGGSLIALSDGGFAASWGTRQNGVTPSPDGAGSGGGIQVFTSTGTSAGAAFSPYSDINAAGTGNQGVPLMAALEGGGFAATWNSVSGPGDVFDDGFGLGGDTYVRVFDNSGTAVSSTLKVNDAEDTDEERPEAIVALDGGDFVIVWHDEEDATTNFDDFYVRTYNADGTAKGASVRLGGATHDNFFKSFSSSFSNGQAIVPLTDGGFAVTWITRNNGGTPSPDGSSWGRSSKSSTIPELPRRRPLLPIWTSTRPVLATSRIPNWRASPTGALRLPGTRLVVRATSTMTDLDLAAMRILDSMTIRAPRCMAR